MFLDMYSSIVYRLKFSLRSKSRLFLHNSKATSQEIMNRPTVIVPITLSTASYRTIEFQELD